MAKTRKTHPLTVRCAHCTWARTGPTAEMLKAQAEHRAEHVEPKRVRS